MKAVFCFIDDAAFELDNFREHAAPAFQRAEMIYASTFAQAQELLDGRWPACFLLDLYGRSGQEPTHLPDPAKLEEALAGGGDVSALYQGLDSADAAGETGNQFLRRVFARVEAWQSAFRAAAGELGQGTDYGLGNLAAVRQAYPWAAAVGYSRKSLFRDAVDFLGAGGDGVLQKPQGKDEAAIAKATEAAAPELARACYQAVDRRLARLAGVVAGELCLEGKGLDLAEAVQEVLRHLSGGQAGEPHHDREEAAQALAGLRLENSDLEQEDVAVLLALRAWMQA